jgi:hypothetical protein
MAAKSNPAVSIMQFRVAKIVLAALLSITGCQTVTAQPDMPALIINPDEASMASLQATLANLFGGQAIELSDDVLTRSSLLTLEQGQQKSLKAPATNGRIMAAPYQFRLVKNAADCVLIDLRDNSRHPLPNTSCVAE